MGTFAWFVGNVVVACCGAVVLLLGFSQIASADVSRNGYGFGIADDDGAAFHNPTDIPSLGENFRLLQPRFFRTMLIWNGYEGAPSGASAEQIARKDRRAQWVTRTYHMIDRAKAQGAQEIVLTLRENDSMDYGSASPDPYLPSPTKYEAEIAKVVQNFATRVDVWGGANEPNLWWGANGNRKVPVATLIQYQAALRRVVSQYDTTARITSPDFNDQTPNWKPYVEEYLEDGGGFGDIAAFHAYADAQGGTTTTTTEYAEIVPSGRDIWLTEVGLRPSLTSVGGLEGQNGRVQQMVDAISGLASLDRVTRIAYYSMRWDGNPAWDSGLLDQGLTRRPAWFTWCAATHGDVPGHPDCFDLPALPELPYAFVDGDRRVDMVGRNPSTNDVQVGLSNGASFSWSSSWGSWGDSYLPFRLADVNGDGRADMVGRNPSTNDVQVGLSNGASFSWSSGWGSWGDAYSPFQLADVNGDGRADMVGRNPSTNDVQVGLSNGASFSWSSSGGSWGDSYLPLRLADVNGDGRADMVGRNPSTNDVQAGLSTGAGFAISSSWGSWGLN
jgi:hypothetical protein